MAKRSLLGLFKDAETAAHAVAYLQSNGFSQEDLDVLSSAPYPEGSFGEHNPKHRLFIFPIIGAAAGFSVAILLTTGTQLAYPLVTGGKPILSIPPMFIITYEGTLLGAIIFTILGIIFESRLPRFRLRPYDPRISEGYIGLLISCPEERLKVAEQVLQEAGVVEVVYDRRGPGGGEGRP